MKRRILLGGMAATTLHAPALQAQRAATTARVGVLSPFARATSAAWHEALERGLRELGWVPGGNLVLDYKFAEGDTARLPDFARELVRLPVDLLVTEVTEATQAAQQVTKTLPIVMIAVGDPVGIGLISSLARPSGNITGLSQNIVESTGKRLELLKLVTPGLSEVAVLWNPDESNSVLNMKELQAASRDLGLQLVPFEVRGEPALKRFLEAPMDRSHRGLYVVPGPLFVTNMQAIAVFARTNGLPSVFHLPEFTQMSGLLAYGPDRLDLFRRAASYIDRILKGAKPAELPVEQPIKYELSINLRTAKAIGLTVPPLVLAQAGELIE